MTPITAAARGQRGVGHDAHQAGMAAAVDQLAAELADPAAHIGCHVCEAGGRTQAGTAINAKGKRRHERIVPHGNDEIAVSGSAARKV